MFNRAFPKNKSSSRLKLQFCSSKMILTQNVSDKYWLPKDTLIYRIFEQKNLAVNSEHHFRSFWHTILEIVCVPWLKWKYLKNIFSNAIA